jgi:hypothetical protein
MWLTETHNGDPYEPLKEEYHAYIVKVTFGENVSKYTALDLVGATAPRYWGSKVLKWLGGWS